MTPIFFINQNLSGHEGYERSDRAARAAALIIMIVVCAVAHFEFMRLISPLAASLGF